MTAPPRRFGPEPLAQGARFRLFAPEAEAVELEIDGAGRRAMQPGGDGFFAVEISDVAPGALYRFTVDGQAVPDPASRMQAEDADGWSVLTPPPANLPRRWSRPWREAVIAEVHVGTATPEGTFRALIDRLDHYRDAGFTVIELMPVADFPGRRNWGYDGVLLYAPDRAYGTPDDLRALIDAAHERGLGMMLDVVYNHFGPSGNFLPLYAKSFFRQDISTPWGPAIDLENEMVRAFFTENAAYWLADFGFDGLRFDAVHALATKATETFLREIAQACRAVRPDAFLVLENHDNVAQLDDARRAPVHRPVERRLAPRLPRARDRRAGRLLRALCRRRGRRRRTGAVGRLRLPGRALSGHGWPSARNADGRAAARRLRQLRAEPRPYRQPAARRPARRLAGAGAARLPALRAHALAGDPAAVPGRRGAAAHALPLLLRLRRRARGSGAAPAAARNSPSSSTRMARRASPIL